MNPTTPEKIHTGFKVTIHNYSGDVENDEVIYTDPSAADYVLEKEKKDNRNLSRPEESPEVKKTEVQYIKMENGQARVGRTLHSLDHTSRLEMVRKDTLKSLSFEALQALGFTSKDWNPGMPLHKGTWVPKHEHRMLNDIISILESALGTLKAKDTAATKTLINKALSYAHDTLGTPQ